MTRPHDRPRGPAPSLFAGLALPPGESIVAAGGGLSPELVLDAYRHGIFPWYASGDPVLWWSPEPRAILPLDGLHVPRRLARTVRAPGPEVRRNTAFAEVMAACDADRPDGSWIHADMRTCYEALHAAGHAHSLEVWRDDALVGGIYGVAFGGGFAAESMFHRERDMSKVALVRLVEHVRARGFRLLDVQFMTDHLEQFGCVEIPRDDYLTQVHAVRDMDVSF